MSFAVVGAVALGVSAATGVANYIGGNRDRKKAKAEKELAKGKLEKAKDRYMKMDTSNPYLNMENTMEDLTVDTGAAEFAASNNQAAMATTLNNMNQAAGGSGIAALAQALANQGAIANQKASISISEQERANQKAERGEASRLQGLEREGDIQSRNLKHKMAGEMVRLAAGDLSMSAGDEQAAKDRMSGAVDDTLSAAGSFMAYQNPTGGV